MVHNLFHAQTGLLVFLQHAKKKVLALGVDFAPLSALKSKLLLQYVLHSRLPICPWEGKFRRDKMVKDNSETPHIGLEITGLVFNDFRGHKRNGARHFIDALVLLELGRHTKVSNFDRRWCVNIFYENVEMFDVAVHNFCFVHVI